jgi:hypothetical protein
VSDNLINIATQNRTSEVQGTVVNIPAIEPSLCGATNKWLRTIEDLPEFSRPAAGVLAPSGSASQTPIVVDGVGAAAPKAPKAPKSKSPAAVTTNPVTDDDKKLLVNQASTNASGIIRLVKTVVEDALARHGRGDNVSAKEWEVPALPTDHHHDHHDHLQHHQHQRAPQTCSCHRCHHQCHHPATTGAHQVAQGRPH